MAAPSVDGACQAGAVAVMQKAKGSGLFVLGRGGGQMPHAELGAGCLHRVDNLWKAGLSLPSLCSSSP